MIRIHLCSKSTEVASWRFIFMSGCDTVSLIYKGAVFKISVLVTLHFLYGLVRETSNASSKQIPEMALISGSQSINNFFLSEKMVFFF